MKEFFEVEPFRDLCFMALGLGLPELNYGKWSSSNGLGLWAQDEAVGLTASRFSSGLGLRVLEFRACSRDQVWGYGHSACVDLGLSSLSLRI